MLTPRTLSAVLATALFASVISLAAPASASVPAAPVLSNLDTSTPGHVTGTISSPGAPTIYLSAGYLPQEQITLPGDSGTFDLLTWGLPADAVLGATACVAGTCSDPSTATIHPTDVTPQATFSSDDMVGPGDSIEVTVEDTGDVGTLSAYWQQDNSWPYRLTSLNQHGTTTVVTGDGVSTVSLWRCARPNEYCTPLVPGISHHYTILQRPWLSLSGLPFITQAHPTGTVTVTANVEGMSWPEGSSYDATWAIRTAADQVVRSGTASGSFGAASSSFEVPIAGAGLPDGTLTLGGTLTVHTADFGDVTAEIDTGSGAADFDVLRAGPKVTSVTATHATIYPHINTGSYSGSTTIAAKSAAPDLGQVAVVSGTGAVVRTLTYRLAETRSISVSWNGKSDSGNVVPAGSYRLYPIDWAKNRSSKYTTVVVSSKKLVTKTFRKTVTAAGSLFGDYVGPCSTLARPAGRGWAYSLGYYANTKCGTQTFHSSGVSTGHVLSVPAAIRYLNVKVSAYGGPVAGGIPDRAVIRYLRKSGDWGSERAISSGLTWHAGFDVAAPDYITSTHKFRWGFLDAYKSRYDVKSFTVVLTYQVVG